MSKRRHKPDLNALAEDAMESLSFLADQGYIVQVDAIRNFITAQGENFKEMLKLSRNVNNQLARELVGKTSKREKVEP